MTCGLNVVVDFKMIENGHESHFCVDCGKPIPCPFMEKCMNGGKCMWEESTQRLVS